MHAWFDIFERKFAHDEYAYFASEEKKEAIDKIIALEDDEKFVEILNDPNMQTKYIEIDRFLENTISLIRILVSST